MAIAVAMAAPSIEVVALTTVHGNHHLELTTANARRILDALGRLPPPSRGPRTDRPAAVFIAETALAHPGEITLVAIGPLTNLAEAIAHAPEIVDAVTQVVIMGGAWRAPGNITPWAEANVHSDPEAAARDHLGETVAGTEPRVPATTMVAVDVDASRVREMVRRHFTTTIGDAPEPIPRPSPESR